MFGWLRRKRRIQIFGVKVKLWRKGRKGQDDYTELRNVTEIHFNHGRDRDSHRKDPRGRHIAFESDVHFTGMNIPFDDVLEFETEPETAKAEAF